MNALTDDKILSLFIYHVVAMGLCVGKSRVSHGLIFNPF